LNVLIVIPYFGGLKDGNPDVVDLAVELRKRGHMVTVLATSYGDDLLYEEKYGVNIFREKPTYYFQGIDYSVCFPVFKFLRLIKKFDIEIVHGVMEFGTQTLTGMVLSRFMKKPFVLTIQGAVETFGSPQVDAVAGMFDYGVRTLSPLVKKSIILSKNLLQRAQNIGIPKEKIRVIPSGVHHENEFNPILFNSDEIRKKLGLEGKFVIGFSGRLVRLKGLNFLLYAQKLLQKEIGNLHLLVIGDGPERPLLKSISRRLNLNVTFVGWVKRSNVARFLSAIDAFVNPSLTEGLPISVMEAMAMQKAIVATDVGGTSDLVEDGRNGFLVHPSEVKPLVSAIRTLFFDRDLRLGMGRVGRDIIKMNFDWGAIVEKTEKVYEEALS